MAFFREAKPAREPFLTAPASVLGLIAVILAAHVARTLIPETLSDRILETYAFIPARYAAAAWAAQGGSPVSIWDGVVPFVSYMFLHADFLHVGVNCLWLLVAGTPVARRLGTLRFFTLFLVCGVLAAAAYLAVNWGLYGAAIGASGAVSGMMGAAIRIYYGDSMALPAANTVIPRLAPLFSMPILFFSAVWCVANVVAGITGLGTAGNVQAVAWEAHLGGYFAGLFLVGPFDAWRRGRSTPNGAPH